MLIGQTCQNVQLNDLYRQKSVIKVKIILTKKARQKLLEIETREVLRTDRKSYMGSHSMA